MKRLGESWHWIRNGHFRNKYFIVFLEINVSLEINISLCSWIFHLLNDFLEEADFRKEVCHAEG